MAYDQSIVFVFRQLPSRCICDGGVEKDFAGLESKGRNSDYLLIRDQSGEWILRFFGGILYGI